MPIERSSPTTRPPLLSSPTQYRVTAPIFHPPILLHRSHVKIHRSISFPFIVKKLTNLPCSPLLIISHASSRSTSSRSPSHPQLNQRSTLLYFAVANFEESGRESPPLRLLLLPFSRFFDTFFRSTLDLLSGEKKRSSGKERITRPGSTGTNVCAAREPPRRCARTEG